MSLDKLASLEDAYPLTLIKLSESDTLISFIKVGWVVWSTSKK